MFILRIAVFFKPILTFFFSSDNHIKTLKPIYRSPDGKFHLSNPNDSKRLNCATRRSKSITSDQNGDAFCFKKDTKNISNRPLSDSILVDDNLDAVSRSWAIYPKGVTREIDSPSLEIDCSQSDIEVRIIANEQNSSLVPSSLVSPQIYDLPSPSSQIRKYAATPYITDPVVQPRVSITQRQQVVGPISSLLPNTEYVYLQDIGIPCADSPVSDVICSSPSMHLSSSNQAANAQHQSYTYHSHVFLPKGHYHLSPRKSFDSPSPQTWMGPFTSSTQPKYFQSHSFHPEASHSFHNTGATNTRFYYVVSNKTELEDMHRTSVKQMCSQSSKIGRVCNITSALPAIPRETTVSLTKKHVSKNSNNNAAPSPASFLRGLGSYSVSMPTLPCRKTLKPKQQNTPSKGKRSASTDDVKTRSDTESDRRFSFASGSASTVRYNASKESGLALVQDKNTGMQISCTRYNFELKNMVTDANCVS